MDYSFQIIDYQDVRWLDFISTHPDSTIFHHPRWLKVITSCYGYHPFIAVLINQASEIQAGIPVVEITNLMQPKRWISLPFTDACSPLARDTDVVSLLIEKIATESQSRGIQSYTIRGNFLHPRFATCAEYVQSDLAILPTMEEIKSKIKGSDLRKMNQADRHGVKTHVLTSEAAMDVYYRLHLDTRHRHGLPTQPKCFFDQVQKELIANGLGFVSLATIEGEPVAGGVFLHWKRGLYYKYAASNNTGRKSYASDPVVWTALEWGIANQMCHLDWGRTDINDQGLRRFKNRWGSTEYPLIYTCNRVFPMKKNHSVWMDRLQKIIAIAPVAVSRYSGELFYRYFG